GPAEDEQNTKRDADKARFRPADPLEHSRSYARNSPLEAVEKSVQAICALNGHMRLQPKVHGVPEKPLQGRSRNSRPAPTFNRGTTGERHEPGRSFPKPPPPLEPA